MKKNFLFGTMLASVVAGFAMAPAPASAQYYGKGFIYHSSSGKCLDFAAYNTSSSVTMQLWTCGGNSALNQQWEFIPLPVGTYPNSDSFVFRNVANWTCAAVENDSLSNAAKIVQRTCDINNPSQHWIHLANSVIGSTKTRWMNGRSAKCLDAWSNNNGTVLQQYTCAGNSSWGPQGFETHLFPSGY